MLDYFPAFHLCYGFLPSFQTILRAPQGCHPPSRPPNPDTKGADQRANRATRPRRRSRRPNRPSSSESGRWSTSGRPSWPCLPKSSRTIPRPCSPARRGPSWSRSGTRWGRCSPNTTTARSGSRRWTRPGWGGEENEVAAIRDVAVLLERWRRRSGSDVTIITRTCIFLDWNRQLWRVKMQ